MSVQTDVGAIKSALEEHEANLKAARRSSRRLHNLLSAGLAAHGWQLCLAADEITAFGGGTNKDEGDV